MSTGKLANYLGRCSAGTVMSHLCDRVEAIERQLGMFPIIEPPEFTTKEIVNSRWVDVPHKWSDDDQPSG
jgi:hypothetical protein